MTWLGLKGFRRSGILASSGVRLPFRLLQAMHAATKLVQWSLPPRDFGNTWSTVSDSLQLQYWHLCLSRRSIFFRDNMMFLYGTRT